MADTLNTPDQPTAVKRPPRRWYQYSLRTLLIFVTLVGSGLGWLGMKMREARQQQAAVVAIESAGGRVQYDYQYDAKGVYDAYAAPPGAAWLHALLGDDF